MSKERIWTLCGRGSKRTRRCRCARGTKGERKERAAGQASATLPSVSVTALTTRQKRGRVDQPRTGAWPSSPRQAWPSHPPHQGSKDEQRSSPGAAGTPSAASKQGSGQVTAAALVVVYLELLDEAPGVGGADEDVALRGLDEAVVHRLVDEGQQEVVVPVHVQQAHLQVESPPGSLSVSYCCFGCSYIHKRLTCRGMRCAVLLIPLTGLLWMPSWAHAITSRSSSSVPYPPAPRSHGSCAHAHADCFGHRSSSNRQVTDAYAVAAGCLPGSAMKASELRAISALRWCMPATARTSPTVSPVICKGWQPRKSAVEVADGMEEAEPSIGRPATPPSLPPCPSGSSV
jgi:hypothetical protein